MRALILSIVLMGCHDAAPPSSDSPLHTAAAGGDLDALAGLLEHRADVHARNRWGETPLHSLAHADPKHTAIAFEALRAHGASLDDKDARGWSPLHSAARWNNTTMVRKYIELGQPLSVESHAGETPFDVAIVHRSNLSAQMLFDRGGRAHYVDTAPPIHAAARDDDVVTLEALLEIGADKRSTFRGLTPLEMAQRTNASAAVRLLGATP